jgi:hypothetical protein
MRGRRKAWNLQAERRLYSYISDENVFFAITFSLSFMLGAPAPLSVSLNRLQASAGRFEYGLVSRSRADT